jgi:hypothetical protein
MAITFFPEPPDPHGPARHTLDEVLRKGTSRIMVACAFCSGAGIAIMSRHLERLRVQGSCLVVSADHPTDVVAVNSLAKEAPGNVWMHKTGKLPTEKRVGSALMHSKVFYSEAGGDCWLWVGSHNLTARATTGANLEAALLLTGHPLEAPFQAARKHIEACRAESWLCPVELPPGPDGDEVDLVIVHTESEKPPGAPFPWHVRLGLESAQYDSLLSPPAEVRLHLYRLGALVRGWRHATPWATYGGTLTGLNLTDRHPETPGTPAQWDDVDFSITESHDVLQFSKTRPGARGIVTQAVINITSPAPSDEVFLPARPKVGQAEQIERQLLGSIYDDLAEFFTKRSVQNGRLVYEINRQGKANWQMSLSDLRESDQLQLFEEARERQIGLLHVDDKSRARHPLIMRAKFMLRRGQ